MPVGAVGFGLVVSLLPNNFPFHGMPERLLKGAPKFKRIDFGGVALLLIATVLLTSGLQEAGIDFAWDSAFTISVLVLSGISWIAFVVWSYYITRNPGAVEPVFPWRFFQSRICMATLL